MAGTAKQRSVIVTLRVKHEGKWRRFPAAYGRKGRIRPGFAQIGEQQVKFEAPAYELRLYKGRQASYEPVGRNAADAEAQRQVKQGTTTARATAESAGLRVLEPEERKTLSRTASAYVIDAENRGAMEAAEQARNVQAEFLTVIAKAGKQYVDEITRDDIFAFYKALRKRGCSDRTLYNKHMRLSSWLRFAGLDKALIPPAPRYEEQLPTTYTSEQTAALLEAADPYMRIAVLLALKTGLRDGELTHLEFRDINPADKVLRVRSKPQWNWTVKVHEQREVPVPDDVLAELETWKTSRDGQTLVLGTANRKPNTKLLLALKRLAKQAGLNCGHCDSCLERKECSEYTLHRFRRTYLTRLLQSGMDLRTVQHFGGHKDLASTMRYLRPAQGTEAQAKLNSVKW